MVTNDEQEHLDSLSAISEFDLLCLDDIKSIVKEKFSGSDFSERECNLLDAISRIKDNLKKAPMYYRHLQSDDDEHYFQSTCGECGWFGSSRFLGGGAQIADTGDYDDIYCPICGSKDV